MKVGLVPVLYEASKRTGGRVHSRPSSQDPKVVLELGAMRIPKSHATVQYYMREFAVETQAFPNPGTTDTMISFENDRETWKRGDAPPSLLKPVLAKLQAFFGPKISDILAAPANEQHERWGFWVDRYKNLGFLDALCLDNRWTSRELAIVGAIGFGLGGLDAQFRVCFLELLRSALGAAQSAQQPDDMILGNAHGRGAQCLTESLWRSSVQTVCGTHSVADLQKPQGGWRPAARAIHATKTRRGVEIVDADGETETFAAAILTCTPRALQLGVDIDDQLLSKRVTRAIRGIHYVNASKVMCVSDQKFWESEGIPAVTLTDRVTRATYLMDYGKEAKAGACLLSYTWGDDSTKLLALTKKEQIAVCLKVLDEIHGGRFSAQALGEFEVVQWELEAGYNGGFKLTYPGQYEENVALFNQFKESLNAGSKDGLFLAGEGVSWVGGFIEGALHSGLNAAFSVLRLLGGRVGAP
jgi:tryptophan 2-monooxygenase